MSLGGAWRRWNSGTARRSSKGFGDALALGVEIVVTPLLFAPLGWWLDGRFGTGPLFAIVFGAPRRSSVYRVRAYYWYRASHGDGRGGQAVGRQQSQP